MSDRPLISIVLPTYNGSRYLRGSLDSVLTQTFADWELTIVDDCSTDGTPEIIHEYQQRDARIKTLRNETNLRLPQSLNRGFAEARGDYLTWTSDDNVYRPNALERMLAFLQTHSEVDLVYAKMSLIDSDGQVKRLGVLDKPDALGWYNPVGACFLYRRQLQQSLGGYRPEFVLVEDYEFWLRASLEFRLQGFDEDLYLYRWHPESLTSRAATQVQNLTLSLQELYLPRLHWMAREDRGRAYLLLAEARLLAKDYGAARQHFLQAVRYSLPHVLRFHKTSLVRAFLNERLGHVLRTTARKFRGFVGRYGGFAQ